MSCASCHNDGGGDGRVWDLTGMGEGLRNTISLRGKGGMAHGFLHWSAQLRRGAGFRGSDPGASGGTGLLSDVVFNQGTRELPLGDPKAGLSSDLDAMAAYLASLNTFAPSPHRAADGSLTADGVAGRAIFQAQGCAQCHGGANFTESGAATLRDVGTIRPGSGNRSADRSRARSAHAPRGVGNGAVSPQRLGSDAGRGRAGAQRRQHQRAGPRQARRLPQADRRSGAGAAAGRRRHDESGSSDHDADRAMRRTARRRRRWRWAGTASDNVGVTQVSWVEQPGWQRHGDGDGGLVGERDCAADGQNLLTVTARDAAGNTAPTR